MSKASRKQLQERDIARGPGPGWLRIALVVIAGMYYFSLVRHPPQVAFVRPAAFFTDCTCLFPAANMYALEYRLEGWSCARNRWEPLDPRAYFPIESDDKESRFQRYAYFYQGTRVAMESLDDWIEARHADVDDAVSGPIGGIRLYKWNRTIPPAGDPIERYVYRPLDPIPAAERKALFWTRTPLRKTRCGS